MQRANDMKAKQREELLKALKARFEKSMNRHTGLEWTKVQAKLEANTEKPSSLNEMERTGGEPDVVGFDKKTGEYIFYDCSAESPKGRRSVCYDREGLESRKESVPWLAKGLNFAHTAELQFESGSRKRGNEETRHE
jgi:hypothetical protein